jgi:hypothetical protein
VVDVNAAPLAESTTTHAPSQALLNVLRENSWKARPATAGAAMLFHPAFGSIEIRIDMDGSDRLIPLIDGRQVSFRYAMAHVVGEV